MRGFTLALRQLADRAEHSFANVRLDGAVEPADSRAAARAFATELSRLVAGSTASSTAGSAGQQPAAAAPSAPVISANRPIEITV